MSTPATSPARSTAPPPTGTSGAADVSAAAPSSTLSTPVTVKLAVCASGASALLYFVFSEGVRNHLAMLADALRTIAGHL